jgi:uncharacterized protein YndB with AHSA1/START domain
MNYASSCSVTLRAPLSKVWEALTSPAIVKQYFFGTALETTWRVGSPLFFRGEWEGKPYEDRGTVVAFEPEARLSFNYWSAFSGKADVETERTIVEYALEAHAEGVRLTVRQGRFDSQARADDSAKNWQSVIDGLKRLLEAQR